MRENSVSFRSVSREEAIFFLPAVSIKNGMFSIRSRLIGLDHFIQSFPQWQFRVLQYELDHTEDARAVQVCQVRGIGHGFAEYLYRVDELQGVFKF